MRTGLRLFIPFVASFILALPASALFGFGGGSKSSNSSKSSSPSSKSPSSNSKSPASSSRSPSSNSKSPTSSPSSSRSPSTSSKSPASSPTRSSSGSSSRDRAQEAASKQRQEEQRDSQREQARNQPAPTKSTPVANRSPQPAPSKTREASSRPQPQTENKRIVEGQRTLGEIIQARSQAEANLEAQRTLQEAAAMTPARRQAEANLEAQRTMEQARQQSAMTPAQRQAAANLQAQRTMEQGRKQELARQQAEANLEAQRTKEQSRQQQIRQQEEQLQQSLQDRFGFTRCGGFGDCSNEPTTPETQAPQRETRAPITGFTLNPTTSTETTRAPSSSLRPIQRPSASRNTETPQQSGLMTAEEMTRRLQAQQQILNERREQAAQDRRELAREQRAQDARARARAEEAYDRRERNRGSLFTPQEIDEILEVQRQGAANRQAEANRENQRQRILGNTPMTPGAPNSPNLNSVLGGQTNLQVGRREASGGVQPPTGIVVAPGPLGGQPNIQAPAPSLQEQRQARQGEVNRQAAANREAQGSLERARQQDLANRQAEANRENQRQRILGNTPMTPGAPNSPNLNSVLGGQTNLQVGRREANGGLRAPSDLAVPGAIGGQPQLQVPAAPQVQAPTVPGTRPQARPSLAGRPTTAAPSQETAGQPGVRPQQRPSFTQGVTPSPQNNSTVTPPNSGDTRQAANPNPPQRNETASSFRRPIDLAQSGGDRPQTQNQTGCTAAQQAAGQCQGATAAMANGIAGQTTPQAQETSRLMQIIQGLQNQVATLTQRVQQLMGLSTTPNPSQQTQAINAQAQNLAQQKEARDVQIAQTGQRLAKARVNNRSLEGRLQRNQAHLEKLDKKLLKMQNIASRYSASVQNLNLTAEQQARVERIQKSHRDRIARVQSKRDRYAQLNERIEQRMTLNSENIETLEANMMAMGVDLNTEMADLSSEATTSSKNIQPEARGLAIRSSSQTTAGGEVTRGSAQRGLASTPSTVEKEGIATSN
jgi:hypothetical protein